MEKELKHELMIAALQHSKDEWYSDGDEFSNTAQRAFTFGAEWMEQKYAKSQIAYSRLRQIVIEKINIYHNSTAGIEGIRKEVLDILNEELSNILKFINANPPV